MRSGSQRAVAARRRPGSRRSACSGDTRRSATSGRMAKSSATHTPIAESEEHRFRREAHVDVDREEILEHPREHELNPDPEHDARRAPMSPMTAACTA